MRLYLYGSLLDPRTLAARAGDPALSGRLQPAVLRGWRRVTARRGKYPTLVRARNGEVRGAVVTVSHSAFCRLQAYEGEGYRLRRVRLWAASGAITAFTWIASAATKRNWSG